MATASRWSWCRIVTGTSDERFFRDIAFGERELECLLCGVEFSLWDFRKGSGLPHDDSSRRRWVEAIVRRIAEVLRITSFLALHGQKQ